jgi:predicted amidohydrolase
MIDLKIKVAAAHSAPVFMNKTATLEKVITLINDAAAQSIELLAFPEVYVPGFPYYINCYEPNAQAVTVYQNQSVVIPDDLHDVQAACQRAKMTVVLGVSERMKGGHTLFNSIVTIDEDGTILGVRRKLQPTWAERYVWGQGSGYTVKTYETKKGYRIGSLACWEHTMNLARQALIEQGQHIHVGLWPAMDTTHGFEGIASLQLEALMKNHALTGQVFSICASTYVDQSVLDWMEKNIGPQDKIKVGGGWTAIIHPFCNVIAGPEEGSEEKLVIAELDLAQIGLVKAFVDANGHFKRPEVFKLSVDSSQRWPDEQDVVGPIPL